MMLQYVIMDKENFLASNVTVWHPHKEKGTRFHSFSSNTEKLHWPKKQRMLSVYSRNYKQLYYSSVLLHSLHTFPSFSGYLYELATEVDYILKASQGPCHFSRHILSQMLKKKVKAIQSAPPA